MKILPWSVIDFKAASDATEIPITFKPTSCLFYFLLIYVFIYFFYIKRKNTLGVQRLFLFPFIHFLNIFTCTVMAYIALGIVYAH